MAEQKVPEDMQEVEDQVVLMRARGFEVSEDDVIREALKNGFQALVDDRLDGNYDTVRWDDDLKGLQIVSFDDTVEGEIRPAEDEASFIDQFKTDASKVWFKLDDAAGKIIGR